MSNEELRTLLNGLPRIFALKINGQVVDTIYAKNNTQAYMTFYWTMQRANGVVEIVEL
jgi:hypothetical protein